MIAKQTHRAGTVLLAVLIVVVLLSLAAYQYSELMTAEYRAADSSVRAAQAHSFAVSGVHYIAAALADTNTLTGTLNNNWYDNSDAFKGVQVQDGDNDRLRGRFSLVAPPAIDDAINGGSASRFGVTDESGKININALVALNPDKAHDMLILLPNMTEEIADAIIDWIDADDEPRANGAESDYYSGLGYRCKNGPLDTLEELLLVRGVTPQLLFGSDSNRNGKLDANEDSSNGFDPGWAAYLTVYSRELNRASDNTPRIYLNDSDLNGLYDKLNTALGEEMATWIIAYRLYGSSTPTAVGLAAGAGASAAVTQIPGGTLTKDMLDFTKQPKQLISYLADLIDSEVSIPQPGSGGGGGSTGGGASGSGTGSRGGTTGGGATGSGGTGSSGTGCAGASSGGSTGSSGANGSGTGSRGGTTGGGATGSGSTGSSGTGSAGASSGGSTNGSSNNNRGGSNTGGGASGAGGGTTNRTYQSPLRDVSKQKDLLPLMYDKVSTRSDAEIPARININTAPKAVLMTLPGLDENDVQTILDGRPIPGQAGADTTFQSPSWIVTEASLSTAKLKALERYITAQTQTYRVQALGYFDKGGPVSRVEAVIDTNGGQPRILLFRDLTELGRGFEVPR
jgi:type II secretory pathway component PulK